MADRFPSLEDFDSTAQAGTSKPGSELSADDFLAREKAMLGDDASRFATSGDSAALGSSADNLLGGNDASQSAFDSQFPDLVGPSPSAGGHVNVGPITGPSISYNSGYQTSAEDEEEPMVIKEWREKRDAQIVKRTEQFAAQRAETIKDAQQNIDDFYENYNAKKDKGIAQTRKDAEQFFTSQDNTVSGGTSWERITKLVDVSGKGLKGGASGSGKERFREVLVGLRKDEKAPGATAF